MKRRKKVALNIAVLAICTIMAIASASYLILDFLNYFMVIEGMPESLLLVTAMWIVFIFCIWLGSYPVNNLFAKRFNKAKRRSKRAIKSAIQIAKKYLLKEVA